MPRECLYLSSSINSAEQRSEDVDSCKFPRFLFFVVVFNEQIRLFATTAFPTGFNYLQADSIKHKEPCGKINIQQKEHECATRPVQRTRGCAPAKGLDTVAKLCLCNNKALKIVINSP